MVSRESSTHALYCPPGPRVTAAKHPPPSALATAKSSPFPGNTSRSRCSGDSLTRALLLSSRRETNYKGYVNKVNDQTCCITDCVHSVIVSDALEMFGRPFLPSLDPGPLAFRFLASLDVLAFLLSVLVA